MSRVTDDGPEPEGRPLGRRAFLAVVGAGLTSLAWGGSALDLASKSTLIVPEPIRRAIPVGEGWRIYAVNPPYPRFDPATWRLRIDGLVARPQTLSFDDLLALPQAAQTSDFHCVTGWSVRRRALARRALRRPARGRRAAPVRARAEVRLRRAAVRRHAHAPPGAHPGRDARARMDDRPLTRAHGAPARVVMPQMYGYKGVKWLERIVVTDRVADGFWEQRGYDRDAWVGGSNGL